MNSPFAVGELWTYYSFGARVLFLCVSHTKRRHDGNDFAYGFRSEDGQTRIAERCYQQIGDRLLSIPDSEDQ